MKKMILLIVLASHFVFAVPFTSAQETTSSENLTSDSFNWSSFENEMVQHENATEITHLYSGNDLILLENESIKCTFEHYAYYQFKKTDGTTSSVLFAEMTIANKSIQEIQLPSLISA